MENRVMGKPGAALALAGVGVAIQVIALIVMPLWTTGSGTGLMMGGRRVMMNYYFGPWMSLGAWSMAMVAVWVLVGALTLLLSLVGLYLVNSSSLDLVRRGSILVLVASLIAVPTVWGFFFGSLIMMIGAILGLAWTPVSKVPRTV